MVIFFLGGVVSQFNTTQILDSEVDLPKSQPAEAS